MSFISLLLLAIALSVDACVVSFAHGLVLNESKFINAFSLGFVTGGFQALMPLIGYYLTQSMLKYVEPFGKWLVFAIFMYLGIKIIQDTYNDDKEAPLCLSFKCILLIGLATSIDALAAGVTLSLTSTNILKAVILIGLTTFLFSFAGYWCGCFMKKLSTKVLEIIAGLILIFLSVKSLF